MGKVDIIGKSKKSKNEFGDNSPEINLRQNKNKNKKTILELTTPELTLRQNTGVVDLKHYNKITSINKRNCDFSDAFVFHNSAIDTQMALHLSFHGKRAPLLFGVMTYFDKSNVRHNCIHGVIFRKRKLSKLIYYNQLRLSMCQFTPPCAFSQLSRHNVLEKLIMSEVPSDSFTNNISEIMQANAIATNAPVIDSNSSVSSQNSSTSTKRSRVNLDDTAIENEIRLKARAEIDSGAQSNRVNSLSDRALNTIGSDNLFYNRLSDGRLNMLSSEWNLRHETLDNKLREQEMSLTQLGNSVRDIKQLLLEMREDNCLRGNRTLPSLRSVDELDRTQRPVLHNARQPSGYSVDFNFGQTAADVDRAALIRDVTRFNDERLYEIFWSRKNEVTLSQLLIAPGSYPNQIADTSFCAELRQSLGTVNNCVIEGCTINLRGTDSKQGVLIVNCGNLGTIVWVRNFASAKQLNCGMIGDFQLAPTFKVWTQNPSISFDSLRAELAPFVETNCWRLIKTYPEKTGSRFLFIGQWELKEKIDRYLDDVQRRGKRTNNEMKIYCGSYSLPVAIHYLSSPFETYEGIIPELRFTLSKHFFFKHDLLLMTHWKWLPSAYMRWKSPGDVETTNLATLWKKTKISRSFLASTSELLLGFGKIYLVELEGTTMLSMNKIFARLICLFEFSDEISLRLNFISSPNHNDFEQFVNKSAFSKTSIYNQLSRIARSKHFGTLFHFNLELRNFAESEFYTSLCVFVLPFVISVNTEAMQEGKNDVNNSLIKSQTDFDENEFDQELKDLSQEELANDVLNITLNPPKAQTSVDKHCNRLAHKRKFETIKDLVAESELSGMELQSFIQRSGNAVTDSVISVTSPGYPLQVLDDDKCKEWAVELNKAYKGDTDDNLIDFGGVDAFKGTLSVRCLNLFTVDVLMKFCFKKNMICVPQGLLVFPREYCIFVPQTGESFDVMKRVLSRDFNTVNWVKTKKLFTEKGSRFLFVSNDSLIYRFARSAASEESKAFSSTSFRYKAFRERGSIREWFTRNIEAKNGNVIFVVIFSVSKLSSFYSQLPKYRRTKTTTMILDPLQPRYSKLKWTKVTASQRSRGLGLIREKLLYDMNCIFCRKKRRKYCWLKWIYNKMKFCVDLYVLSFLLFTMSCATSLFIETAALAAYSTIMVLILKRKGKGLNR